MQLENSQDAIICKICHSPCNDNSPYAHPCKCNGSLKYIHVSCLNEWIKVTNSSKCGICKYPFKFQKTFKLGTPKSVPPHYILLFLLKGILSVVVTILLFIYTISKFILVFAFNTAVSSAYLHKASNIPLSFLTGVVFTAINFLHSIFIQTALKHITALRPRIQSSQVLQSLIADISTRDETLVSQRTVVDHASSESTDTDEQMIDSFNIDISMQESIFRLGRPINIKSDIKFIISACTFSVFYPFLYHFSLLFSNLLFVLESKIHLYEFINEKIPAFFKFIEEITMGNFFIMMIGTVIFFTILVGILGKLKENFSSQTIRNAFYLLKCYTMSVVMSFVLICSVGVFSHFSFVVAFNRSVSLFKFSESWISIIIHMLIGFAFTYLLRNLRKRLMGKFRDGLIMKALRDESLSCVIEYFCRVSVSNFIIRTLVSFTLQCTIPLSIFLLSRVELDFRFDTAGEFWTFLYLKAFLLLYRNGSAITYFLAWLCEIVTWTVARFFDAENYLYNKKTMIGDRKRLVWAANIRFIDGKTESLLEKINDVLSNNAVPVNSSTTKELDTFNQEISIHSENTDSNTFSRPSKSLINSLNESEKLQIYSKYEITDERIEKYFGKSHTRKFSIFLAPKHPKIFKIFCFLSCLLTSCLFFHLLFRAAIFLSPINRPEAKPIMFVYITSLLLGLFSHLPKILSITSSQRLKSLFNNALVIFYTNILFPAIGAMAFVIVNAGRSVFSEFTNSFVLLNALSSVTSSFFESCFIFSPISSYSVFYLIKQIASFLAFKMFVFLSFIAYSRIVVFGSIYVPIFFTALIVVQLVRFVRVLVSGSLMETIKDHFFLDDRTVANYQHSE